MNKRARNRRRRARNRRYADKAAFHGINWAHYKHHELYDMIMDANPVLMAQRAQQWNVLGGAIKNTTDEVQRTIKQLLTTWRGSAATSAAASNHQLHGWATEASSAATGIGKSLDTYADAVSTAQRKMPPPEFAYSERAAMAGNDFKLVTGASQDIQIAQLLDDQKPNFEKNRAAHAEAVRVMTTYGGQSQVVHDDMPDLPPSPPGRGTPPAVPQEQPQPGPGDSGPGPYPGRPGPGADPGTGSAAAGTTTAAGFADPARAGASGPGPGGSAGGYGGTGYGGGVGGLGSGGGDVARGGPGAGGLAGVGGMAGRPAGAPGAGALGARGAGAPGAFGGMPVSAGAPGEGDKERKNKYDEGLDLFDDLPPAYPPVFGA